MKSLGKYEPLLGKIKQIYILVFIGYILIARIVPLVNFISLEINSLIYAALAAVGAMILAADFFMSFFVFKSRENVLLLVFLAVCVISSLLNMQYGITDNLKTLVWSAIQFFVLFSIVNVKDENEINTTMTRVMKLSSLVWFIGVLVSLTQFFLLIGYIAPFDDFPREQGFVDSRLFGVFTDPNFAAVTSIMVVLFCKLLLENCKSKAMRVYYYANIVVQFIYVVLSGSRTAMYGGAVLVFGVGLLATRNKELNKNNDKPMPKALLGGILATAVCIALIFAVQFTMPKMAELCSSLRAPAQTVEQHEEQSEVQPEAKQETHEEKTNEVEEVTLDRPDVTEDNISNNRFKIWSNYIAVSADHCLFGLSPRNLMSFLKANYPDNYLVQRGYDETHNGWLAIFVCTGIAGTLVMAAFFVCYACDFIRYLRAKKKEPIDTKVIVLLGSVFIIAFSALLQPEIFFINTYGAATFWLFMGYLLYEVKQVGVRSEE